MNGLKEVKKSLLYAQNVRVLIGISNARVNKKTNKKR